MDVPMRFLSTLSHRRADVAMTLTITLPHAAHAQSVTPPPVPTNLQVPAGNEAFLVGHAVGTQNYVCSPAKSVGQVDWTLFTPEATLFDDSGEQLITHYFSPNPIEGGIIRATWEDSRDTSTIWAKATASSVDPAFVHENSVAWLLLPVVGQQVGPTGGATLFATSFVQRLNTVGGAAPSTGCDAPTDLGSKAFVPYTADYFFFKKQ
jgi:Protein of unknown function (DUF3455)